MNQEDIYHETFTEEQIEQEYYNYLNQEQWNQIKNY